MANVIESAFAKIGQWISRTKGCLMWKTMLSMIFKIGMGGHAIELWLPGRVGHAEHLSVIGRSAALIDPELGVLHIMQQHVHAREVEYGDVLFQSVDFAMS